MLYCRLKSDNCRLLIAPRISGKAGPSMLREGGARSPMEVLEDRYGKRKESHQYGFPNPRVVAEAQPV